MRWPTVRAASRRGWVWPMVPRIPRPSSRQILGSWVVLPEPVSPATTTTWLSRMAAAMSSCRSVIGSAGSYAIFMSGEPSLQAQRVREQEISDEGEHVEDRVRDDQWQHPLGPGEPV